MTALTLERWFRLARRSAGTGRDAQGARWLWLAPDDPQEAPGAVLQHEAAALLPLPTDIAAAEVERVLELWPLWRLVRAAALELGMNVVVAGAGRPADDIAALCRRHGALRVERWTDEGADAICARLPGRPDCVFLLDGHHARLGPALQLCRDRGTVIVAGASSVPIDLNLYPDAHRRGLHVLVCGDDVSRDMSATWPAELPRLLSLLRRGLL